LAARLCELLDAGHRHPVVHTAAPDQGLAADDLATLQLRQQLGRGHHSPIEGGDLNHPLLIPEWCVHQLRDGIIVFRVRRDELCLLPFQLSEKLFEFLNVVVAVCHFDCLIRTNPSLKAEDGFSRGS
jgi:hypothetical protein